MGLFLLEDSLGIGLAVAMLIRSLEKGKYQSNLQFETVRKIRPIYGNKAKTYNLFKDGNDSGPSPLQNKDFPEEMLPSLNKL